MTFVRSREIDPSLGLNDHESHGVVYLIMFSSGIIKVGRSKSLSQRVYEHELFAGSKAVHKFSGGCGCREMDMIRKSQNLMGASFYGREWFYGNSRIFEILAEDLSWWTPVDRAGYVRLEDTL